MALDSIEGSLKERGVRLTRQRQILLELIDKTGEHLDAESLYQLAKEKDPKINRVTVYRTLKMLKAAASNIYDATNAATDPVYGALTLREKSLQNTITKAGNDITDMQARLDQIQTNYQNQFTQLEMTLNDMKTQGSYISSITSWTAGI